MTITISLNFLCFVAGRVEGGYRSPLTSKKQKSTGLKGRKIKTEKIPLWVANNGKQWHQNFIVKKIHGISGLMGGFNIAGFRFYQYSIVQGPIHREKFTLNYGIVDFFNVSDGHNTRQFKHSGNRFNADFSDILIYIISAKVERRKTKIEKEMLRQ